MFNTMRRVKRIIVGIVGFTILVIGVFLLVLPGPAFLVIPLGLGILATEFVWAKKLLRKVKDKISGRGESTQPSAKDATV
jgi:uncharacterized protein (TIGR02611 family)